MKIDVTLIIAVIGCIVAVLGFARNKKKDNEGEGSLKADIKYIQRGVDNIQLDIKEHNRTLSEHNARLTKVEESVKSAHHRLDTLEKRGVE
ncbi:MAG: hypothetical protein MR346_11315 [Clostridium sp.]|nr:hypothetical protein [Clostridium sp.]